MPTSASRTLASALQQLRAAENLGSGTSAANRGVQREAASRQQVIEEGLRPWAAYDAYDGDPSYYAMEAGDWLNEQASMMQELQGRAGGLTHVNPNARFLKDMAAGIARDYNISEKEAMTNIRRIVDARGADTVSHAVMMGVPSAHADEKMSRAALELSGFDNARLINNTGNVTATDLQAMLNGREVNIDAQKLLTSSNRFRMGALQNVESGMPIAQMLASMPKNTPVLEALQKLQTASREASAGRLQARSGQSGEFIDVSGNEDKLMQSSNSRHNPNPSQTYQENEGDLRKDALIWTDRSQFRSPFDELRAAGPYDSAPAQSMTLTDLERMRSVLGDVTLGDLAQFGGLHDVQIQGGRVPNKRRGLERDARNRGNMLSDVKLVLPKRMMTQFQGDLPPISEEALRAFTTGG